MSAVQKSHWLRNTIIVMLVCGIVGTALAAALFFLMPDRTCASASLQMSFEGAASGIAPNGNPFNMDVMRSDEVLEAALKATELEGVYTIEQLRENLVVTGSYPEDLVAQVMSYESLMSFAANRKLTVTEYHPTVFKVSLYSDFDKRIPRAKLEALLASILENFRTRFAETYAVNLDWMDGEIYKLDQYDYPQQLEIIQEAMTQQARYAHEMFEKEPAFRLDDKGFNDIYVRFNSLVDSDISRMNANITMNALTRNTARLLTQYQFEIRDLSNQLEKQTEQLARLDKLIASYEKNEIIYLSTADSLTKIDGNSSNTYDELVTARKKVSDEITQINSKITMYQLKLSDLMKEDEPATSTSTKTDEPQSATDVSQTVEEIQELTEEEIAEAAAAAEEAAARQVAALERSINALLEKREAVTADFRRMLQAYMAQEINEQTVRVFNCQYDTPNLLSGAFIKKAIKTAGPICALGFMVCMVLLIRRRRWEEKRSKKK